MPAFEIVQPFAVTWREDSSNGIWCRVAGPRNGRNARGTPYLKADIASILLTVYDVTNGAAIINDLPLTVADVMFDTLQTAWDQDTTGYNFKYVMATTAFPVGGVVYQADAQFTHTDGSVGIISWIGPAVGVYTS